MTLETNQIEAMQKRQISGIDCELLSSKCSIGYEDYFAQMVGKRLVEAVQDEQRTSIDYERLYSSGSIEYEAPLLIRVGKKAIEAIKSDLSSDDHLKFVAPLTSSPVDNQLFIDKWHALEQQLKSHDLLIKDLFEAEEKYKDLCAQVVDPDDAYRKAQTYILNSESCKINQQDVIYHAPKEIQIPLKILQAKHNIIACKARLDKEVEAFNTERNWLFECLPDDLKETLIDSLK